MEIDTTAQGDLYKIAYRLDSQSNTLQTVSDSLKDIVQRNYLRLFFIAARSIERMVL